MALFSFRHSIKTYSTRRRRGQRLAKRGQTISHIRYITREGAAREVLRGGINDKDSKVANQAEKEAYQRKGRVAERFTIALPVEATNEQRTALTKQFSENLTFGGASYIAAIHDKAGNDLKNPHFHLIAFDAHISSGGRGRPRSVLGFARPQAVEKAAEQWASIHNKMMAEWGYGPASMITHLSFADRGIERIPTIHEGPAGFRSSNMALKVKKSEWAAVDSGRTRKEANGLIRNINKLKEDRSDERTNGLGRSIQTNRGIGPKKRGSCKEALGSSVRNQGKPAPPFLSSEGHSSTPRQAAQVGRRSVQRAHRAPFESSNRPTSARRPLRRSRRVRRVYAELKFYHDSLLASVSGVIAGDITKAALETEAKLETSKISGRHHTGDDRGE